MPGVTIFELDCSGSMAGNRPSLARWRDSTMDADKCEKVCTAAGSVKSSAGTYTAWIAVMAPLSVLAMRSSSALSSVSVIGNALRLRRSHKDVGSELHGSPQTAAAK